MNGLIEQRDAQTDRQAAVAAEQQTAEERRRQRARVYTL